MTLTMSITGDARVFRTRGFGRLHYEREDDEVDTTSRPRARRPRARAPAPATTTQDDDDDDHDEMSVQEYLEKHDLSKRVEEALNAAVKAKAEEPLAFVVRRDR